MWYHLHMPCGRCGACRQWSCAIVPTHKNPGPLGSANSTRSMSYDEWKTNQTTHRFCQSKAFHFSLPAAPISMSNCKLEKLLVMSPVRLSPSPRWWRVFNSSPFHRQPRHLQSRSLHAASAPSFYQRGNVHWRSYSSVYGKHCQDRDLEIVMSSQLCEPAKRWWEWGWQIRKEYVPLWIAFNVEKGSMMPNPPRNDVKDQTMSPSVEKKR